MTKLQPLKWITAGALLLIAAGLALAQVPSLFVVTPTGNEQVTVAVPSTGTIITNPQLLTMKITQFRDSVGYSKQAPLTGTTILVGNTVSDLQLTPAGTISTLTVTMPASPSDGQRVRVFSTAQVTTLTVAASAGQTLNGNLNGTLSANTAVEYIYSLSNTTWDRTL